MTSILPNQTDNLIELIRDIYGDGFIPLHKPVFEGNERRYLIECVDSNFVSSVGGNVKRFEQIIAEFTDTKHGVATVNGTSALHMSLVVSGVKPGDEVISQALTFVATCNAITYCGASPVFIDVDRDTLGLSPKALGKWLSKNAELKDGQGFNKKTGARISACVPMHTFGFPLRIAEIVEICEAFGIPVIEDAAESLGSYIGDRHTGAFGELATFSFNGNKVITTGGGGMILTDNDELAKKALHLTTTAKVPHPYEFVHDEVGYNYRLPNLNAALGCAQMENLNDMLYIKADIAANYRAFCLKHGFQFVNGIENTRPNYWLNAIILNSITERNAFLEYLNEQQVMSRPIWRLMSRLEMFKKCQTDDLENSRWLEDRVVNIPSSVPEGMLKNNHIS